MSKSFSIFATALGNNEFLTTNQAGEKKTVLQLRQRIKKQSNGSCEM